jgi:hypothetical protein
MVDEGIDVYVRITKRAPARRRRTSARDHAARPVGRPESFPESQETAHPCRPFEHRFALFDEPPLLDEWVLERGGKRTKVRLKPRLVTNAGEAHVAAVCEGAALGLILDHLRGPVGGDDLRTEAGRRERQSAWTRGHVEKPVARP